MSNQYPDGSLNLEKIQDTIYDWVNSVCEGVLADDDDGGEGGQILWRQQSEPLPPRPCVTLKFIDGPRPIARQGNLHMNPGKKSVTYGIQMEATLSIQIFGNTQITKRPLANQLAVDLNSSLLRQSVLDQLKRGGVAIQVVGSPKNLTALEETRYEERAGFELGLGLVQNITDTPTTIEQVNVSETVCSHTKVDELIIP